MKKQGMKKLVLGRETLRMLDEELKGLAGGITNLTCADSCDTAIGTFCPTCGKTGGC